MWAPLTETIFFPAEVSLECPDGTLMPYELYSPDSIDVEQPRCLTIFGVVFDVTLSPSPHRARLLRPGEEGIKDRMYAPLPAGWTLSETSSDDLRHHHSSTDLQCLGLLILARKTLQDFLVLYLSQNKSSIYERVGVGHISTCGNCSGSDLVNNITSTGLNNVRREIVRIV